MNSIADRGSDLLVLSAFTISPHMLDPTPILRRLVNLHDRYSTGMGYQSSSELSALESKGDGMSMGGIHDHIDTATSPSNSKKDMSDLVGPPDIHDAISNFPVSDRVSEGPEGTDSMNICLEAGKAVDKEHCAADMQSTSMDVLEAHRAPEIPYESDLPQTCAVSSTISDKEPCSSDMHDAPPASLGPSEAPEMIRHREISLEASNSIEKNHRLTDVHDAAPDLPRSDQAPEALPESDLKETCMEAGESIGEGQHSSSGQIPATSVQEKTGLRDTKHLHSTTDVGQHPENALRGSQASVISGPSHNPSSDKDSMTFESADTSTKANIIPQKTSSKTHKLQKRTSPGDQDFDMEMDSGGSVSDYIPAPQSRRK